MNAYRLTLLIGVLLFAVSCFAPATKQGYIQRFESFVNRVEQNNRHYNKKDWEWNDKQFKKYSTDWYMRFRGEYTMEDQIKIKSLIIEYHSYRNKEDLGEVLREMLKEDISEMGEQIKKYIDNNLENDLEELIKGAAVIGDSAVKVLEDVINEIDETF